MSVILYMLASRASQHIIPSDPTNNSENLFLVDIGLVLAFTWLLVVFIICLYQGHQQFKEDQEKAKSASSSIIYIENEINNNNSSAEEVFLE